MEDLLICRVCLATDGKLYNIQRCGLDKSFDMLTNSQYSTSAILLRHLCPFCVALMQHGVRFLEKCSKAQKVFQQFLSQGIQPTLDQIANTKNSLNLNHPYVKKNTYKEDDNLIPTKIEHDDNIDDKTFSDDDRKSDIEMDCTIKDIILKEKTKNNAKHKTKVKNYDKHKDKVKNDRIKHKIKGDSDKVSKRVKRKKKEKDRDAVEPIEFVCDVKTEPVETKELDDVKDVKEESESDLDFGMDIIFDDKEVDPSELLDPEPLKPKYTMKEHIKEIKLSKEEQMAEVRARKETLNYKNSPYRCEFCFKGFSNENTYNNHMKRHSPSSGDLLCELCQTRWMSERTRRHHVNQTHENKYSCRACDYTTMFKELAKRHIDWHNGRRYTCNICGAVFDKVTTHLSHLRIVHSTKSRFKCDLCGRSFLGKNGLKVHKRLAHQGDQKPLDLRVRCPGCAVMFQHAAALDAHLLLQQDDACRKDLLPCVSCGAGFAPADWSAHKKTCGQRLKCNECSKTFAHMKTLNEHKHSSHSSVPRKQYRYPARRAVCEMCGLECSNSTVLKCHMRVHTGEKPFRCAHCGKCFRVKDALVIHIRTHTDERPFSCTYCPKAFKDSGALKRHLKVHTGAKPYTCPTCGKSFSQSNSMKSHIETVHLKMPYKCKKKKMLELSNV